MDLVRHELVPRGLLDGEEIVAEYVRLCFGTGRVDDWTDLVLGLERTWPPEALLTKDAALVGRLSALTAALGETVPNTRTSRARWQYLADRAEMDLRMSRIGSDDEVLGRVRALFADAGYTRDMDGFRRDVPRLHDEAAARAEAMRALFQIHWEYLSRARLDRTTSLVSAPPEFIGQRDWDRLAAALDVALAAPDDDSARMAVPRGIKEWFWYSNISLDFLFL